MGDLISGPSDLLAGLAVCVHTASRRSNVMTFRRDRYPGRASVFAHSSAHSAVAGDWDAALCTAGSSSAARICRAVPLIRVPAALMAMWAASPPPTWRSTRTSTRRYRGRAPCRRRRRRSPLPALPGAAPSGGRCAIGHGQALICTMQTDGGRPLRVAVDCHVTSASSARSGAREPGRRWRRSRGFDLLR